MNVSPVNNHVAFQIVTHCFQNHSGATVEITRAYQAFRSVSASIEPIFIGLEEYQCSRANLSDIFIIEATHSGLIYLEAHSVMYSLVNICPVLYVVHPAEAKAVQ